MTTWAYLKPSLLSIICYRYSRHAANKLTDKTAAQNSGSEDEQVDEHI